MSQLAVAMKSGSLLHQYQMEWGKYYHSALNLLGSTGIILPFGDPAHGQPNATTFTTVGGEQVIFTWSEAPAAFDTPLDLTNPDSFQGIIPVVDINGADEEADTPDVAYFSRVVGAFSIGFWIKPSDVSAVTLLGKLDLTSSSEDAEWKLDINSSNKLELTLYDTSSATTDWTMHRPSTASIVANVWTHVLVTCNAIQTAATDINLYINGVLSNGSGTKDASFTAMEAGGATVQLGHHIGASANVQFYTGPIAGGPNGSIFTQTELSADVAKRLYQLGRSAMAA